MPKELEQKLAREATARASDGRAAQALYLGDHA